VTDPRRDLRLGAAVLICVDGESGIVFDFIITDGRLFAVYERLAFPGTAYAAFSYVVPVADRDPGDVHELTVRYDAADGVARWLVEGAEVLSVDRIGLRVLDPSHLRRDNGLPEQAAAPRQLNCGLGLFTDQIWGQGVRLDARRFEVRATARQPPQEGTGHVVFTEKELEYLTSQRLGRLATMQRDGTLQNNPVVYWYNPKLRTIDIGGRAMSTTQKFRNVLVNPHVSFVIDDVVSRRPWRVRGIEIRGRSEALVDQPVPPDLDFLSPELIRVHPARIFTWGVDEEHLAMTRRTVGQGVESPIAG
jgi:pyridoxamine 5'-phosphate oxidase family protein